MRYLATLALILMLGISVTYANTVKGVVKDAESGTPLIGTNVIIIGTALGSTTDADGFFMIQDVPDGEYKLEVSYIGYQQYEQLITVAGSEVTVEIDLKSVSLVGEAINVIAGRAKVRETPVAFTNVNKEDIEKNLGSRDIPLVLNTTPGIYATQAGGGSGDARINVRGFNQRNVAVMINGVPVNDMENGWVYWSNWDGLGDATSSIQVQRGLGASNLAIASIGGTLNIVTDAAAQKAGIVYKQEIGSARFLKETASVNTGLMGNGLAFSASVVRKTGTGIVDQTWTDAWSYFGALSYSPSRNHTIELYAIGAPQKHGQRLYTQAIGTFDADFAREVYQDDRLPVSTLNSLSGARDYGRNYNPNWGALSASDASGMQEYYNGSVHDFSARDVYMDGEKVDGVVAVMERENFYHKPQFNMNWHWQMGQNSLLSNVAYVSFGRGGGTGLKGWPGMVSGGQFAGQLDFQSAFNNNSDNVDTNFHPTDNRSSVVVRNSVNNHNWYGLISTLEHRFSTTLKMTTGIDLRSYKGEHFRTVRNLLGGDYYTDFDDANQESPVKRLGDKIDYNNDGLTRWYGGFVQLENRMGDFIVSGTGALSNTGYQRVDYFVDPEAHLDENSNILPTESEWQNFGGGQAKFGANWNVSSELNLYTNVGYISKAPIFDAVFDFSHQLYQNVGNEKVYSGEVGSGFRTAKSQTNANFYYTQWKDRTWSVANRNAQIYYLLRGIDARHLGLEVDWTYRPNRFFDVRAMVSVGDWIWQNDVESTFAPEDDPTNLQTSRVFLDGIKVGDSAQKTFAFAPTVYPTKGMYLNLTFQAFGDHFAAFDPEDRNTPDSNQPWLLPNYSLVDLHFGYDLPIELGTVKLHVFGHIFNLFDETFITDAEDGPNHRADGANVFFGLERRFNAGLNISL